MTLWDDLTISACGGRGRRAGARAEKAVALVSSRNLNRSVTGAEGEVGISGKMKLGVFG